MKSDSSTHKLLSSRLTNLNRDLENKLKIAKAAQQAVAAIQREIEKTKAELEKLPKESGVVVSEHAILRYLERVKGVDIASVVQEISDEKVKQSVEFAPTCKIKRAEHTLVIENGVVVTVLT